VLGPCLFALAFLKRGQKGKGKKARAKRQGQKGKGKKARAKRQGQKGKGKKARAKRQGGNNYLEFLPPRTE
jgi:hypothetical protein